MIRLEKGDEPQVLVDHGARWTAELLNKIALGEEPSSYLLTRYGHADIKQALLAETHEKCAYCESPFRHVTYGDVEHIIPKHSNPDLRFSWFNLTLACDVCNTNKGQSEVLDPYHQDPSEAFFFLGPMIWPTPGNADGITAEATLDLNRAPLVQRRIERLSYLLSLVESAHGKPPDVRNAILSKVRRECAKNQPFSACSTSVLHQILTAQP